MPKANEMALLQAAREAYSFVLLVGALTVAAPWLMQVPALCGVLSVLRCGPVV